MCPGRASLASTASRRAIAFARLDERVVGRGRLGEAGEERRLAQVEVARVLREVRLRGCFDPVGEVAVVDLVEVGSQNPLLRPRVVELDREARLLQLPLHGPLVRDVEVAHELLRDRGAALHDLAGADVCDDCPGDALRVDAAVGVEAAVLDCDRRFRDPRADAARAGQPAGCAPQGWRRGASRRLRRRTCSARSAPRAATRGRTTSRTRTRRRPRPQRRHDSPAAISSRTSSGSPSPLRLPAPAAAARDVDVERPRRSAAWRAHAAMVAAAHGFRPDFGAQLNRLAFRVMTRVESPVRAPHPRSGCSS